jgi:hypothetical protein
MKLILFFLLAFLLSPVIASLVGALIYAIVQQPMLWVALVIGIPILAKLCG